MKHLLILVFVLITISFNSNKSLKAQENVAGTVKYQKILKFKFEARDNPRWNDFIAGLPKEGRNAFLLHFNNDVAVYKPNLEEQEESTPELQRAKHIQSFRNLPKPELKRVFYDLKNKKKLEEMNFMTRIFIVESDIDEMNWKLIPKKKQILEHICMGAELTIDDNTLTAWFTPKIPISIGPDTFFGLPGLILMIELNGEKLIVATSISSDVPEIESKEDFSEEIAISKKEFDKIVEEKVEEHKKNMSNRSPGYHRR
jgi:GLPGLI family protein